MYSKRLLEGNQSLNYEINKNTHHLRIAYRVRVKSPGKVSLQRSRRLGTLQMKGKKPECFSL